MKEMTIESIFENTYPVRVKLMSYFRASDLSAFCHAFGLTLSTREQDVFLNPIRDMLNVSCWIQEMIEDQCAVALVGKDVDLLMKRINNPAEYWSVDRSDQRFEIWLAVIPLSIYQNESSDVWTGIDSDGIVRRVSTDERCRSWMTSGFMWPEIATNTATEVVNSPDDFEWWKLSGNKDSDIDLLFYMSTNSDDPWVGSLLLSDTPRSGEVWKPNIIQFSIHQGYEDWAAVPYMVLNNDSRTVKFGLSEEEDRTDIMDRCSDQMINLQIPGLGPSTPYERYERTRYVIKIPLAPHERAR